MLFYVCTLLTGIISYFISAIFNRGIYFFPVFFAVLVLNIEVLSLLKGISGINILILTVIETFTVSIIWFLKNKPVLKINVTSFLIRLKNIFKKDGILILPCLCFLFFIIISFILACFSPVTEPDAQSYHALRVLFWLKDGFISHFETTDIRNLCMPFNSECFYTWVLALAKKDTCFGLLQFFSYILLIFSSYKTMEILKIPFVKRIWAILVFSSLPAVITQISSTQTDLTTASLISLSIYLVLQYKKTPFINLLFFASLSSALSFGVKTTAFMISIPVFIWFILLLKKDFLKFFFFLVVNFLIFSSYSYILNFIDFGNFFANNAFITYNKFFGGIKAFIANYIKYIIQFIDFTGFKFGDTASGYILAARDSLLNFLNIPQDLGDLNPLTKVNIYMTEQYCAFGILGFLVFLPASFIALFDKKLKPFAFIFHSSFLILCASMMYTTFGIRYMTGFVAVALPVFSLTYFKKTNFLKALIIIFCIYYMNYAALFINQRPFIYLMKAYIKTPDLSQMQNKMRDMKYNFYGFFGPSQAGALKSAVEPFCANDNKIAIFASGAMTLYPVKYLEIDHNCRIDTLNLLHIEKYDLSEYKAVITLRSNPQAVSVLNRNDIENPVIKSNKVKCSYLVPNRNRHLGIKGAVEAHCIINPYYLQDLGFKKANNFGFWEYADSETAVKKEIRVWAK